MIGITPRLIEKIRFHTVICKPVCVIQKAAEDQRYRRATDAHTADQDFRRIFHAHFMRHHQQQHKQRRSQHHLVVRRDGVTAGDAHTRFGAGNVRRHKNGAAEFQHKMVHHAKYVAQNIRQGNGGMDISGDGKKHQIDHQHEHIIFRKDRRRPIVNKGAVQKFHHGKGCHRQQ